MKKYIREILWGTFALYCVLLMWVLFFSREAETMPLREYLCEYTSLLPFQTTLKYIRYIFLKRNIESVSLALLNIGGNLLLFLPMGTFLPLLFPQIRRPARFLLHIAAVIVSAEFAQAFLRLGIFDVDDILYNFIGAFWGFSIKKAFRNIFR